MPTDVFAANFDVGNSSAGAFRWTDANHTTWTGVPGNSSAVLAMGTAVTITSVQIYWHYGGAYQNDGSAGPVSGAAGNCAIDSGTSTSGPWTEILVIADPVGQAGVTYPDDFDLTFPVTQTTSQFFRIRSTTAANNDFYTISGFGPNVVAGEGGPGYWIDWAGDGFDDGSGGTASGDDPRLARGLPQSATIGTANGGDNVTAYVKSATWQRGGSYDHVGANGPGGFTIYLDNSSGRFSPDNTASDLFGFLTPGRPVWAGAIAATGAVGTANGTGAVAGFLAGYVREFVPTVDSSGQSICEVIGEDAFGRYGRTPVSVTPSLTRSHQALRGLVLDGVGESVDRRDLDTENGTMPFSAVESENGLDVLEELNRATATRHYIRPADSKEEWYDYVSANKLHKFGSAEDQSLDGDDITNVSGWRVTNDNVVELQKATVVPISLTPDNGEVWRFSDVPFTMSSIRPKILNVTFDDYVFDASVEVEFASGSSGTASISNYGKTATIGIWATSGGSATVGSVRVLGQQVVRGDSVTVIAGDTSPGAQAGSTISSDFIGQTGAAQGLVDFIVWKFGQPLKRPNLTVYGKNAATFATIFSRDLYDVLTMTIDRLSVTSRRVEIVGLRGSHTPGRSGDGIWSVTYELQETPNQSAVDWFLIDDDVINSPALIAPF